MTLHLDATTVALIAAVMSTLNVALTAALGTWFARRSQLTGWKRDLLYPAIRTFLTASSEHLGTLLAPHDPARYNLVQLAEKSATSLGDMARAHIELVILPTVELAEAANKLRTLHIDLNSIRTQRQLTSSDLQSFDGYWSEFVRAARQEIGVGWHGSAFKRQLVTIKMDLE